MKKPIATPSRTKEILETHGMFAKKNYGQNFLIEPGIVEKIARSAVISDHCAVLEIGPGIGALTQYLCEYARQVVSFEIDERLPEVLQDTLAEYDNFELVMKDFLEVDLKSAADEWKAKGMDVVIAANLPYYITTPILFKIFESGADISAITVMMQKEVADRFAAAPNTKDYNALSVITQYRCHVKPVMKVPKNVFMPKPRVDSAVLQFTLKGKKDGIVEEAFFSLVKACFRQRRKTIYNNYQELCMDKEQAACELKQAGIDKTKRAEGLDMEDFLRLYEVHYGRKG